MAFNYDKSGPGVLVGPLEAEVLDVLWTCGEPTGVPDVHRAVQERRPISYSAVKAVLNNLLEKGWLSKELRGKVTFFASNVSREQFEEKVLDRVIGSLRRNYGPPVIAQFVDHFGVDEASLDELERLLAEKRKLLSK